MESNEEDGVFHVLLHNEAIDALEAFAKEQRVKGMEAARMFFAQHSHHATGTILSRIDAEIAKLKEGG